LVGLEADLGVGEGWIEWLATPLWRSKKMKNSEKYLGRLHLVTVKKLAIHFISKFLVWFDSQLYKL